MKYLFILIICLASNFFICFAQQTFSNPIALGPILVDQPTADKMAELCQRYKLNEVPSDDGYRTFKHNDGTLIKFAILSDSTRNTKPYIEIYTTESKKVIEQTVLDAGYHKEKNCYEKGHRVAIQFTICRIIGNKNKRVIFTKERGKIKSYNN